jgi:hypothetical protein
VSGDDDGDEGVGSGRRWGSGSAGGSGVIGGDVGSGGREGNGKSSGVSFLCAGMLGVGNLCGR